MKNLLLLKYAAPFFLFLFIYAAAFGASQKDGHPAGAAGAMSKEMAGQHDDAGSVGEMSMEMGHQDIFLQEKEIDNYTVSFHVMPVASGMEQGGSHNFMVKIEQHGEVLDDVAVNSKVIRPDKSSETKRLLQKGDWYMNGYDLGESGEYQLIILFKTSDGKKHHGGVYYPENVEE
jgi:hypothetical protein